MVKDFVYSAGGFNCTLTTTVEWIEDLRDTALDVSTLRLALTRVVVKGFVYSAGGFNCTLTTTVEWIEDLRDTALDVSTSRLTPTRAGVKLFVCSTGLTGWALAATVEVVEDLGSRAHNVATHRLALAKEWVEKLSYSTRKLRAAFAAAGLWVQLLLWAAAYVSTAKLGNTTLAICTGRLASAGVLIQYKSSATTNIATGRLTATCQRVCLLVDGALEISACGATTTGEWVWTLAKGTRLPETGHAVTLALTELCETWALSIGAVV